MTVIRKRYEDQLNDLLKDLRALGLHTYSMLQKSIKVLSDEEITHARQIVKSDRKINQMEYDINEKVVMLITRQQPIAKDLRMMIATL
ncbi:phosphate transport system regulatory protein PhoU, partial [Staphylococcus pseudintermedius]